MLTLDSTFPRHRGSAKLEVDIPGNPSEDVVFTFYARSGDGDHQYPIYLSPNDACRLFDDLSEYVEANRA